MKAVRFLAVLIPLGALAIALCTVAWACLPEPQPPEEVVIVPAVPAKSLAHWWEVCDVPHRSGRAYYVGEVSAANLVLRRNPRIPGGMEWGPAVREEGYTVTWRGDFGSGLEIHVQPQGWSLDRIKADLERCEGRSVNVVDQQSSTSPTS